MTITITVGPLPTLADLPEHARNELLARIAYACDWSPASPQADWPHEVKVYVEVYTEEESPGSIDFHELHNLYLPANGHGFYSAELNKVWFRVGCSWDDESSSTINRDWYGNFQHWM